MATATAKKRTDSSGATPEGTAAPHEQPAQQASQAHEASGKKPLWSRTINRVDCSIWKHEQTGQLRYTVAISRSYVDRKSNQWKHSYYFDKNDLKDVQSLCSEAEEHILGLEGMTTASAED